jgi:hypothetical protein
MIKPVHGELPNRWDFFRFPKPVHDELENSEEISDSSQEHLRDTRAQFATSTVRVSVANSQSHCQRHWNELGFL